MGYIDTVKQWFVTKAKPTQTQYHTLFDYLRFKDQQIPLADVQGLITLLQSKLDVSVYEATVVALSIVEVSIVGNGIIEIPAGYLLEKIIMLPSVSSAIKVGLTLGGEEIFPENIVSDTQGEVLAIDLYAVSSSRQIYLTGFPADSSYVKFIRKIKDIEP